MEEGEGRPPAGDGWTAALELDRAPEFRQASAAAKLVGHACFRVRKSWGRWVCGYLFCWVVVGGGV